VKGEERVGLGESGFYERDIYITVAVVNTMNISHPLPSVTKWRYVIISRYFLYNLIQDPYIGKLHLVYTCNTHADHSSFLFMLLVGVCDLFHSVSFCCPRYLGRSRRESRISKLCSCDLNVTSQSHRTALVSQLSPFPTRVSPGFGKAIDI